jgi:hypothetical protein
MIYGTAMNPKQKKIKNKTKKNPGRTKSWIGVCQLLGLRGRTGMRAFNSTSKSII